MTALLRLLGTGRGHGRRLLLAGLLAATTSACAVALMGFSAWLISRAAEHPSASALTLAAVAVRAFGLGRGVARYAERLVGHDATLKAVADLRVAVFQALVRRSDTPLRSGEALSGVVADVEAVQDLWLRCAIPAIAATVVSAASVAACWWWLPQAGWVLLGGLLVSLLVVPVLAVGAVRGESALADLRADYQVQALDVVHGCADLLVFGDLSRTRGSAEAAARRLAELDRRAAWRGALVSALTTVLQGATVLGVLAVSLPAVESGGLSRVGLAVVVLVALASFEVVLPLPEAGALLPRTLGAARRLALLLDGVLEGVRDERTAVVGSGATSLQVRGVRVSYPQASGPALEDIDLDLRPGRCVAVVGPSGAGKSTLLRVLSGQLVPEAGTARMGGVDLGSIGETELARHVVLAEQEAHLFDASLRDNLRLARPGADDRELAAAADLAGLGAWIEGLPQAWDTPVGERGGRVSGGERRRLSVARALLSDAPVVLLDEPTEGLDAAAADALVRRVVAARRDRALLLVTHRLAALDEVDEVIVLDRGRVVQRGTPAELRERPGPFLELWSTRAPTLSLAG